MSANDIRELENLDRITPEAGGDLYLVNGNMLPLGLAGAYATNQPNSSEPEPPDGGGPPDSNSPQPDESRDHFVRRRI